MTDITPPLAVPLEPCPFCGDAMEIGRGDVLAHRDQGACPIGIYAWGADGRAIAAWNKRTPPPRPAGGECPSSPDGRHQVDTSMESGPNNCFHCEAPMGVQA